MKSFWKKLVILLIAICLEITVVPYLLHSPFDPDLILICLFYFGFYFDQVEAGILGVIGGLLRDSYTHGYFGLSALVYGLTSFLAGFFRRLLIHYPVVAFSFALWSGTFLVYFFYYFLLYLFGFQISLDYLFASSLKKAFSNFLIAILVSLAAFLRTSKGFSEGF